MIAGHVVWPAAQSGHDPDRTLHTSALTRVGARLPSPHPVRGITADTAGRHPPVPVDGDIAARARRVRRLWSPGPRHRPARRTALTVAYVVGARARDGGRRVVRGPCHRAASGV